MYQYRSINDSPSSDTFLVLYVLSVEMPYKNNNMCYSYEEIERQNRRRLQAERRRRSMSRIALTPSNLIYPMRAPSNIAYSSPPPAYRERASPAYREHASPVDGYVLRGDRRPSVVREDGHL